MDQSGKAVKTSLVEESKVAVDKKAEGAKEEAKPRRVFNVSKGGSTLFSANSGFSGVD